MAVVYFQILVISTISAAYWVGRWKKSVNPLKVCAIATLAWIVFTLMSVITTPLLVVQLGVAGGTFVFWRYWHKQNEDISHKETEIDRLRDQLKSDMSQFAQSTDDPISEFERKGQVKIVTGREHMRYLENAMLDSQDRIMILSGWVRSTVVNYRFLRNLQQAVERGCDIYIGFGWRGGDECEDTPNERKAFHELNKLSEYATRIGRLLVLRDFRNRPISRGNHVKVLLVDRKYVICGSFNWLSNSFGGNEEMSFCVEDPEFVEEVANNLLPYFGGYGLNAN